MFMSRHQNAGQNRNKQIANKFFRNVAKLKHFGREWKVKITFAKNLRAD